MLYSCFDFLSNPPRTEGVCLRALEEPTVAANGIIHAILRGACEF